MHLLAWPCGLGNLSVSHLSLLEPIPQDSELSGKSGEDQGELSECLKIPLARWPNLPPITVTSLHI